ncbi:MAG: type IV pilus biogenesis protein PilM [Pedobacter sp.]
MKIFGGKSSSTGGATGISREEGGIGLAHVTGSLDKPFLAGCEFFAEDAVDCEERLQEEVKRRGLVRSRGIGVIGFGSYGLFQVAPPAVQDAELRDAVRWQVKDLIDYPLEEAIVDVFRVGADNRREGSKNAYVVAARQLVVQQQARLMRHARLKIDAIDIPELCLRNLASRLPEDARGVSLLYLGVDQGVIIVCRGGRLQLARDIPFGTSALSGPKADLESSGFDEPQERLSLLALDIQRSLDFYESSFRQTPVAALYLLPTVTPLPELLPELQARLGTSVKNFVLGEVIDGERQDLETAESCLLAVGAALRHDREGA